MAIFLLSNLDRAGISLSIACAVHCILPWVVLVFGIEVLELSESAHQVLLGLSFMVSIVAISIGYSRHCRLGVVVFAVIGMVLVLCGVMFEDVNQTAAFLFIFLGCASMIAAHFRNSLESLSPGRVNQRCQELKNSSATQESSSI